MNSPECNVCHIDLDEDEHQPRHLGCSHDACTACVKVLIKNGSLECPMCRQVVKANTPEDLKINHGVVQVLRMIKEFKMSEMKAKNKEALANDTSICRIHKLNLAMRCVPCKLRICVQCKEIHTADIGCELQDYDFKIVKKEHKQKIESTLSFLRGNIRSYSSEMSQIESEKNKLERKVTSEIFQIESEIKKLEKKLATIRSQFESDMKNIIERQNMLHKIVDEGSKTLNEIELASTEVDKAISPIELNHKVNIYNDLQQIAQILCKKYPFQFLKLLRSGKEVYTSKDINGNSNIGKVALVFGNMYLHCLRKKEANGIKSSIICPYEQVVKCLPVTRDLVFLDLAIAGSAMGRITIRLRQDLSNYSKYIPQLCTGEEGHSLMNTVADVGSDEGNLAMNVTSTSSAMNKFTRDANAGCHIVQGCVVTQWSGNVLSHLCIYFGDGTTHSYNHSHEVIGQVESGLNNAELCRSHSDLSQIKVINCGIVIKEDALTTNTLIN